MPRKSDLFHEPTESELSFMDALFEGTNNYIAKNSTKYGVVLTIYDPDGTVALKQLKSLHDTKQDAENMLHYRSHEYRGEGLQWDNAQLPKLTIKITGNKHQIMSGSRKVATYEIVSFPAGTSFNDASLKVYTDNKKQHSSTQKQTEKMANNSKTWKERSDMWKKSGKISPNFKFKQTGTQGKRPYIEVPVGKVTLPSNTTIIQRKRLGLPAYNGKQQFETYVLACSKKTQYGDNKFVQNWYVAKVTYYGGHPGVMEFYYQGTNERTARQRFAEIPYHFLAVKVQSPAMAPAGYEKISTEEYNGRTTYWATFKSNGSYKAVVAASVANRQNFRNRRNGQN